MAHNGSVDCLVCVAACDACDDVTMRSHCNELTAVIWPVPLVVA